MKRAKSLYVRSREVLLGDKAGALPREILTVLPRELSDVLGAYFDVESVSVGLDYDEEGVLWLTVQSRINAIRTVATLPSAPVVLSSAPTA